jgi:Protein of unknown function (DUF3617)
MLRLRTIAIHALMLAMAQNIAFAGEATLLDGSYEVTFRLELPHVERWAIDQTATICLANVVDESAIPIPVFSANTPFAKCAATNLAAQSGSIEYDIICPGRGSAKAHARYVVDSNGFKGRVAMVMAAKNMTMTEVVLARRIGACRDHGVKSGDGSDARAGY